MSPSIPVDKPDYLPSGGLRNLLRGLESDYSLSSVSPDQTGRILLKDENQKEGSVYFRSANIYAVTFDGFVPPIATRLYTGGYINEEVYQYLNHQVAAPSVETVAIKNGYVAQEILNNINRQMILSSLTYLYGWERATWNWEQGKSFDGFAIPNLPTDLLLAAADERMGQWEALSRNFPNVTKAGAVPCPGSDWDNRKFIDHTPEMNRIASMVDGSTTIAKMATLCGFTRFEIAALLAKACIDGILIVIDPKQSEGPILETAIIQNEYDQAKRALETAIANVASAKTHLENVEAKMSAKKG